MAYKIICYGDSNTYGACGFVGGRKRRGARFGYSALEALCALRNFPLYMRADRALVSGLRLQKVQSAPRFCFFQPQHRASDNAP